MRRKISILGTGSWGASIAFLFSHAPNIDLYLWDHSPAKVQSIQQLGYFPQPNNIIAYSPEKYTISSDLAYVLADAEIVVCAIPSDGIKVLINHISETKLWSKTKPVLVSATKGLDQETGDIVSHIWQKAFPQLDIIVLSGPNLSAEAAQNKPMRTVLAGQNIQSLKDIEELLSYTECFFCSSIHDTIGLELAGAIKNVIAIAGGAWDAFELGTSGKGCLLTKALLDIKELVALCGGHIDTVDTVGGIGDLFITCSSSLSRNYRTGSYLASGHSWDEIHGLLSGQVSEGVYTANLVQRLCKRYNYEFQICDIVADMVSGDMMNIEFRQSIKSRFIHVI